MFVPLHLGNHLGVPLQAASRENHRLLIVVEGRLWNDTCRGSLDEIQGLHPFRGQAASFPHARLHSLGPELQGSGERRFCTHKTLPCLPIRNQYQQALFSTANGSCLSSWYHPPVKCLYLRDAPC